MDLTTDITQPDPSRKRVHESAISATAAYGYIPGLDGLRAIAVLIVLVAHFGLSHIVPGGFGVTVFFFISGFLITRLLIAESDKKGGIGLKDFYVRRFIRLIPALIGMTFVTTAIHMALSIGAPTI
ncbi:MAG: acyltransferase, partial [Pseudomonadota bacterium]